MRQELGQNKNLLAFLGKGSDIGNDEIVSFLVSREFPSIYGYAYRIDSSDIKNAKGDRDRFCYFSLQWRYYFLLVNWRNVMNSFESIWNYVIILV